MVSRRSLKKDELVWWNRTVFANGLLYFVVLMVSVQYWPRAECAKTEPNQTGYCSGFRACVNCTAQDRCSWWLARQTCAETDRNIDSGGPKINVASECPRFSAIRGTDSYTSKAVKYALQIENDVHNFFATLNGTIRCTVVRNGTGVVTGRVTVGRTIVCEPFDVGPEETLLRFHVWFGGDVVLRLDDESEYYYASSSQLRDGLLDCVTCLWSDRDVTYYWKLCKVRYGWGGEWHLDYFDGFDANDFSPVHNKSVAVDKRCSDAQVLSVQPPFAPWTGGTTVEIDVKHHRVLAAVAESVSVMVAGRECVDPTTTGRQMITCVVSKERDDGGSADKGPVRVRYRTKSRTYVLRWADKTFRFEYPVAESAYPACGPLEGGVLLTVRGRHLEGGSEVRVFTAGLVPCTIVQRSSDQIRCLTGRVDEPVAAGRIRVEFEKSLFLDVQNGSFSYAGDVTLDAGQRFSTIASGGTTMLVRGSGFSCAEHPTMYVAENGTSLFANCTVTNDATMVCRTPPVRAFQPTPGEPVTLPFGFRAKFHGFTVPFAPHPDSSVLTVYADPKFREFEVTANGAVVTVQVDRPGDRGYRAEDVDVRLPDPQHRCAVKSTTHGRITCTLSPPYGGRDALRRVTVAIGDRFVCDVMNTKSNLKYYCFLVGAVVVLVMMPFVATIVFRAQITTWIASRNSDFGFGPLY